MRVWLGIVMDGDEKIVVKFTTSGARQNEEYQGITIVEEVPKPEANHASMGFLSLPRAR
jgi:hypothetical protein